MNKNTLPRVQSLTLEQIRARLVSAVTQYDARESTKRGYNPYALGQYLERVEAICADIAAGATPRAAICAGFLGRLADACLRSLGLPKTAEGDEPRGAWHYVPVAAKDESEGNRTHVSG